MCVEYRVCGVSVECVWSECGVWSVECVWSECGVCVECVWSIGWRGVCVECVGSVCGLSVERT